MRRIATVLLITTLATGAVACSSSAKPDDRADQPPTTQTDPREAAVRETLMGYFDAYGEAVRAPTSRNRLAEFATGRFLSSTRNAVEGLATANHAVRDGPKQATRLRVRRVQLNGEEAIAVACEVSDEWVVEVPSGKAVNTETNTYQETFYLQFNGSTWRIGRLTTQSKVAGDVGCPK